MNQNPNKNLILSDLGLIAYKTAWDFQESVLESIHKIKISNREDSKQEKTENYFFLCEHPHVYTLGKSGLAENLLLDKAGLDSHQVTFFKTNRGGDITYHGPGQIVGYPVIDLENFFTDIHKYLRYLEEVIIRVLAEYDIIAGRYEGYTGVWLDADKPNARKICAMGVKCKRWITMHGFALNVKTDLSYFNHIVPCGITDKAVTSIEKELGYAPAMKEVQEKLFHHFIEVFEVESSVISESEKIQL
jgi:lipoyl(octanoyl) transferase